MGKNGLGDIMKGISVDANAISPRNNVCENYLKVNLSFFEIGR